MELDGAHRCFKLLLDAGLRIPVFISDRHTGLSKWTAGSQNKYIATVRSLACWQICGQGSEEGRKRERLRNNQRLDPRNQEAPLLVCYFHDAGV